MKPTFHPPHFLILVAPMLALPLLSPAQVLPNTANPQTTTSVTLPMDLHAAGTISSFNADGLTMLNPITGSMTVYMTNADTMFVDTRGRIVSPDKITQQTPVTVHYTPVGNMIVATKVVVNTALTSDGILVEVSPGVLGIQMTGASTTATRDINNTATKYVDHKGRPAPQQSVKAGAPVRVFYTTVGDTLVASKVEILGATGQPNVPVQTQTTTTTTSTREIKR